MLNFFCCGRMYRRFQGWPVTVFLNTAAVPLLMTLVLVYVLVLLDTRGIPPSFLCKGTFLVRLKGTFSRHEFKNQPSSDLHEAFLSGITKLRVLQNCWATCPCLCATWSLQIHHPHLPLPRRSERKSGSEAPAIRYPSTRTAENASRGSSIIIISASLRKLHPEFW